jgi:hypothetical protein
MLKWLAILAVVLAVAQASMPILGQTANSSTSNGQKQDNGGNSDKNPSQKAVPVVGQDESSPIQQSEPKETPSYYQQPTINITNPTPVLESWSWHDKVAWGAGLLLLVVGSVTLWWFIIQTIATKKAAEAAMLNAQFLVDSERAWMIGTPDITKLDLLPVPGAKFIYKCNLRNVGRTPARMIQAGLAFRKAKSLSDIPQTPIYEEEEIHSLNKILIIPQASCSTPQDSFYIRGEAKLTGEELIAVKRGTGGILYAYGFVKYLDSFHREHETHFCHYYHVPGPYDIAEEGFQLCVDAPREYNKAT